MLFYYWQREKNVKVYFCISNERTNNIVGKNFSYDIFKNKSMDKKIIEELKSKLIEEKEEIEKSLKGMAQKDPHAPGGWRASVPDFDGGSMEEESDEVENYQNLLSQESSLENQLKEIISALEEIKNGKYGLCENCKKEIEVERLKTYPAARTCLKCK